MEAQNYPKQDSTVWYLNICDVDPYLNSYYVLPYKYPWGFPVLRTFHGSVHYQCYHNYSVNVIIEIMNMIVNFSQTFVPFR